MVSKPEPEQTHGFLHVKTEDGTQGWVWSRNIHVQTSVAADKRIFPEVGFEEIAIDLRQARFWPINRL